MSADPADVMLKLDAKAVELGNLADALTEVQRSIEPIEKAYDDACGDYEAEWYLAYEKGERKWPGADVRRVIARRHIDPDMRDRYDRLAESRGRIRDRIDNVSKTVTAYQSILRALREEMGATR